MKFSTYKTFFKRRRFIASIDDADSYIRGTITCNAPDVSAAVGRRHVSIDANLKMADCNNTVEWGFEIYSPQDAKEKLVKLRAVQKFINAFVEDYERALKHRKEILKLLPKKPKVDTEPQVIRR